MNVMNILRKSGRMELADLASLLLPVSVVRKEKDGPGDDESGEDCEECEEDEEECVVCRLRGIIHKADQNGKASNEDKHSPPHKIESRWRVFPFRFWAEFTTSGGTVEQ